MHEKIHLKSIPKTKILYEQCNKGVFGAKVFAAGGAAMVRIAAEDKIQRGIFLI